MGGCRCVYRNCPSSTNTSPGLHYFHFPIRDQKRCDEWIKNAKKQSFYAMPREKLRNKVICSLHFEDRYFTNQKHDRLVHNAVPTLGCEDAPDEDANDENYGGVKREENITLIPTNEDNTKFILPDEVFSGMSYTIYDDNVVPSSTVPLLMSQNEQNKVYAVLRKSAIEPVIPKTVKRPKFTVTSVSKITPVKTTQIKLEPQVQSDKNVTSYSLSTDGDDFKVELSQKTSDFDQLIESKSNETPLLNNEISFQQKGENEFTISVLPEMFDSVQQNIMETTEIKQNDPISTNITPKSEKTDISENVKKDFAVTPEKEYIRQIKNNSRQIVELKKLINKQNRLHKHLIQKKQLCKFRKKDKFSKIRLVHSLKKYVKPSLSAILKLEILEHEDIVLTDGEEKFLTQLYTEDPECYNVLRKKYNWNLPSSEVAEK